MKNSFLNRIHRLRQALKLNKVEAYFTANPIDIFYLTGLQVSRGELIVSQKSATIFLDGRYLDSAKKSSPISVTPLLEPHFLGLFGKPAWKDVRLIGFDAEATSYQAYEHLKKRLEKVKKARRLKTSFRLKALECPVKKLRSVKEPGEIKLIQKSAELLWQGFEHVRKKLKTGVRECDIALEFEMYCRKKGAESLSFTPIVAFGKGSAFPHYHTGVRKLKKGDIALLDLGVYLDGYASDMTRVIFHGDVSAELHKIYAVVKKAHEAALSKCHPGEKIAALDTAARSVMKEAGLENRFLHSLGHGIGLEVHEYPSFSSLGRDTVLEPGMVLTIEPGLYLPGKGGVRYEDMVVVTKNGFQNLFKRTRV